MTFLCKSSLGTTTPVVWILNHADQTPSERRFRLRVSNTFDMIYRRPASNTRASTFHLHQHLAVRATSSTSGPYLVTYDSSTQFTCPSCYPLPCTLLVIAPEPTTPTRYILLCKETSRRCRCARMSHRDISEAVVRHAFGRVKKS